MLSGGTGKSEHGDNGGNGTSSETLADRAKRLRKAMGASDTGPLLVGIEVDGIAKDWQRWKAEADNMSADGWCRRGLGKPLKYFTSRANAVRVLGEHSRRVLNHEVAVWLVNKVRDDDKRNECMRMLTVACKSERNGMPLSKKQAQDLLRDTIGATPKCNVCVNCTLRECECEQLREQVEALKSQIVALGGVVEEVSQVRGDGHAAE